MLIPTCSISMCAPLHTILSNASGVGSYNSAQLLAEARVHFLH